MYEKIPQGTSVARRRRIHFALMATDGNAFADISTTDLKASLRFADGTTANSTNDITKESAGDYYLELTEAEAGNVIGPVKGKVVFTGVQSKHFEAFIAPAWEDPYVSFIDRVFVIIPVIGEQTIKRLFRLMWWSNPTSKTTGFDTNAPKIRDANNGADTKDVISVTGADQYGNRTSVTLNLDD